MSVVDRYGNEYAPVVFNATLADGQPAVLTYPKEDGSPLLPSYFTWQPVDGADSYFVEIARDSQFEDVIGWHEVGEPQFYSGMMHNLEEGKKYFWRVLTRAANRRDVWSESRSFTGNQFTMEYPGKGAHDVPIAPVLVCDSVAAPQVEYLFEIANRETFKANTILFSGKSNVPHIQVPDSVLSPLTVYFVRATATYDGITSMSEATSFKTVYIPAPKPVILSPQNGDTIVGTNVEVVWQEQSARGFRVELSTHAGFAPRMTKTKTGDAYTFSIVFEDVEAGGYYLRVRASDESGYVDSDILQILVQTPSAIETLQNTDAAYPAKVLENGEIIILMPDGKRYDVLGRQKQL